MRINKQTIFIAIFLVVVVAIVVTFVVFQRKNTGNSDSSETANESEGSLGADIANKAQNPLGDKLPETNPAGAINPIEGAYQNPFGD